MTIPQDKVLHFVGCFAIAYAIGCLDFRGARVLGLVVGITIGAAKEWVYDARHPQTHTVDVKDFYASAAGSVAGFLVRVVW